MGEQAVLNLIMLRLLCAVGENHQYSETVVSALCSDAIFTCKGKTIIADGFKQYLKNDENTDDPTLALPVIVQGEIFEGITAKIKEGKTSPPKQFTEDVCCKGGLSKPLKYNIAAAHLW